MTLLPGYWVRHKFRSFSCAGTLEEVSRWICEAVPPELGPFAWVGGEQVTGRTAEHLFRASLDALASCANSRGPGAFMDRCHIFLGSERLTPELCGPPPHEDVGSWLVVNGLPFITVLGSGALRRPTGMTIVHQVREWEGDGWREHTEYLALFRRLERAVRKRLLRVWVRNREEDGAMGPFMQMALSPGVVAYHQSEDTGTEVRLEPPTE